MHERADIPLVSVVMPMFNASLFLAESVRSILDQDVEEFELIIVDDGSTDGSADHIMAFTDPRIRLIRQPNQGVAQALITGMRHARAPLIARHDADDVALPGRLRKPIDHLRNHPEIGLVGAAALVMDTDGAVLGDLRHPTDDPSIRFALLFDAPFVHPAVTFRRSVYDTAGGYRDDPSVFEDYDLWWRMSKHARMANLPEPLVRYRQVQASASRRAGRDERTIEQRRRNLMDLQPSIPIREARIISRLGFHHDRVGFHELRRLHARLIQAIALAGASGAAQERLRAQTRERLGCLHLTARSNTLSKAADRLLSYLALRLPIPSLA